MGFRAPAITSALFTGYVVVCVSRVAMEAICQNEDVQKKLV
jgi:hypothetical protein